MIQDAPILFLAFGASCGAVVLIWLVQLIVYPTFLSIDRACFRDYHAWYTRRVGFVVIPLMLCQAATAVLLAGTTPLLTAYAVAVTATWIVTFSVSVPCHNALAHGGFDRPTVERLIRTNWLRTGAWSAALLALIANG